MITIEPHRSISEAAGVSRPVSSLPVVSGGSVLGILHRNAVEKAVHHGLKNAARYLHDYMNPGAVFVTPDEPIERVLRMTVEGRHRIVPVLDEGRMVGVISRSDLLEHLKLPHE